MEFRIETKLLDIPAVWEKDAAMVGFAREAVMMAMARLPDDEDDMDDDALLVIYTA